MQPSRAAQVMSPPDILDALRWRYAVKDFDSTRKIPEADWKALEDSLVLNPSSYGLQPWRFIVVKSPEIRERLLTVSMKQGKVVSSSHLVVFAARTDIVEADIDRWIGRIAEVRHQSLTDLQQLRTMMMGDLVTGKRHQIAGEWAKRQVYLALGGFLTTAAVMGIDVCPMEGFDPDGYDEILGLKAQGFTTAVIATVGYRCPNDTTATQTKVRYPKEAVIASV